MEQTISMNVRYVPDNGPHRIETFHCDRMDSTDEESGYVELRRYSPVFSPANVVVIRWAQIVTVSICLQKTE